MAPKFFLKKVLRVLTRSTVSGAGHPIETLDPSDSLFGVSVTPFGATSGIRVLGAPIIPRPGTHAFTRDSVESTRQLQKMRRHANC